MLRRTAAEQWKGSARLRSDPQCKEGLDQGATGPIEAGRVVPTTGQLPAAARVASLPNGRPGVSVALSRLKLQELTPAYVEGATILAASETVIITVSGSTGEATKPYFS